MQKMRFLRAIGILLFSIVLLVGCNSPKSETEMYGTYQADYKIAKEKLTLNKDGTFEQEVTIKATGKVDTAKGTWEYTPSDGYITFNENFMSVLDGFGEFNPNYAHPKPGLIISSVNYFLGHIDISLHEDIAYKKK